MFEGESLDRNTPIPLYYQLYKIILRDIKNGDIKEGESIPTEIELMSQFDISRATVRQAIMELVNEGYLNRMKGKGTYVCKQKVPQSLMECVEPFKNQMQRINMQVKTDVLYSGWEPADEELSEIFGVEINSPLIHIERLRYGDNEPLNYATTILNSKCSFILGKDLSKESLYETLDKREDLAVVRAERQFEAIGAGKCVAELLKIKIGSPIQHAITVGYSKQGEVIEYTDGYYIGNKNRFSVTIAR